MNPDDAEIRVSYAFYPSDTRALRRLTLALRDQGLDVVRTDVFRALLHVTSEAEMFAFATLRLKQEAVGKPAADEVVDERFTLRVRKGTIKKVDRVIDDLARKDLDADRTLVSRAILHGEHDVKSLVKATRKFLEEIPDGRTSQARAKRRG